MSNLTRITGKIFGETATATGADPEIGQFGSALAGTYNGTTDVSTIQGLAAWSNGFISSVTPNNQYPPLPEMTGFGKVLSHQICYNLQHGIPEWDSATDYYINCFCSYNGVIYKSLTDNNLNNIPEGDTVNWEAYTSGGSSTSLITGQTIFSIDPLTDQGLHLLDGSQYATDGIYADFVTNYLTVLKTAYPNRFKTEADWQTYYTAHGVCGYWVLDTENNLFRFPKVTGIVEGTLDPTEAGLLVEASIPNIKTEIYDAVQNGQLTVNGAGQKGTTSAGGIYDILTSGTRGSVIIDASIASPVYKDSATTVQPQTIKGFLYIVVANSPKTETQIDIDEIATDLALKADISLTNIDTTAEINIADLSAPSATYQTLTLGASGSTYTAPSSGWFVLNKVTGVAAAYIYMQTDNNLYVSSAAPGTATPLGVSVRVAKGESIIVGYTATGTTNFFGFVYAEGSESEAN